MTASLPLPGLRRNLGQFSLLVLVNAFVGAMVGMERSILPAMAEHEFQIAARTAILSFIAVFGLSKAFTNFAAGHLADRIGRKPVLVAGWLVAAPVPFLLMWAPNWPLIVAANALLGISQGLTWSTTVIMKVDLVGARRRGLAMGLNEFAGYLAVAGSALATGWIAASHGFRPAPFLLGVGYVAIGLSLSVLLVRETRGFVTTPVDGDNAARPSAREIFLITSFRDRNLSTVSLTGWVNNLNDGMAWGLFPLVFAAAGMSLAQIGGLVALYPTVWGGAQIFTGAVSDRLGRKGLIVSGMWLQAIGIATCALWPAYAGFATGAILLGLGTAMVYPTLLATLGDVAPPTWRASVIGVYRFWRDLGYAAGALIAGFTADAFGLGAALWVVAALTALSGLVAALRLQET